MKKENLQWAWRILKAKAFIAADERYAICLIPMVEPFAFDNITLLSAQYSSLSDMRDRLNDVLDEHQVACKELFRTDLDKYVKPKKNLKEVK